MVYGRIKTWNVYSLQPIQCFLFLVTFSFKVKGQDRRVCQVVSVTAQTVFSGWFSESLEKMGNTDSDYSKGYGGMNEESQLYFTAVD